MLVMSISTSKHKKAIMVHSQQQNKGLMDAERSGSAIKKSWIAN